MAKAKSDELRPYAWEKVAFLEDANVDSRITDAAFRVLQKICAAYNRKEGYAECARTFIVDRVPVTVKTVQRARRLLLEQGRVFIVRKPVGRSSTRYGVNWWFRGSNRVRAENNGKPLFDIRFEGTLVSNTSSVEGTSMSAQMDANVPSTARRGDMVTPKPMNKSQGGSIHRTSAPGVGAPALRQAPARASVDRVVRITASTVEEDEGEQWLNLTMTDEDGAAEEFGICVHSNDQGTQERGQARLEKLKIALGLDDINDPADVVGIPFLLTANDSFRPVAA